MGNILAIKVLIGTSSSIAVYGIGREYFVARGNVIRGEYLQDIKNVTGRNPMQGNHHQLNKDQIRASLTYDEGAIREWKRRPFYERIFAALPIKSIMPIMMTHHQRLPVIKNVS